MIKWENKLTTYIKYKSTNWMILSVVIGVCLTIGTVSNVNYCTRVFFRPLGPFSSLFREWLDPILPNYLLPIYLYTYLSTIYMSFYGYPSFMCYAIFS